MADDEAAFGAVAEPVDAQGVRRIPAAADTDVRVVVTQSAQAVRDADRATPRAVPTWPGTQLLLQRQLIGESLVAEKHLLTHLGHGLQVLEEAALYERGVVAVAIEHRMLQPGEASAVFVIRERRGDE